MTNNVPSIFEIKNGVPTAWVEKLFSRFEGLYGNRFLDMWRDTNLHSVKAIWAEAMAGLTAEDLQRGCASLMEKDWPPTLPEFVKMCKFKKGEDPRFKGAK